MDPMTEQRFDSLTTAVNSIADQLRLSTDVDALTTEFAGFAGFAVEKRTNPGELVPVESSILRKVQVGFHVVAMALPLGFYCVVNHVL